MKSKKPCIRYVQIHKNGEIYIQFENHKSYMKLADEVVIDRNNIYVEFIVRDRRGYAVAAVTGQVVKETKSGVILSKWGIRNDI